MKIVRTNIPRLPANRKPSTRVSNNEISAARATAIIGPIARTETDAVSPCAQMTEATKNVTSPAAPTPSTNEEYFSALVES